MSLRSRLHRLEAPYRYDDAEEEQAISWAHLLASAECYETTGCPEDYHAGNHPYDERDLTAARELLHHFREHGIEASIAGLRNSWLRRMIE